MTCSKELLKILSIGAVFISAYLIPSMGSAALISATLPGSGNECSGQGGFSNCFIFNSDKEKVSPVIIKFDADLGFSNSNSGFPTIDGSEWDLDTTDNVDNSTGDWTYTKDNIDDPDIRFWVTFAKNSVVYFNINDADIGLCGAGSELSAACMDAAIVSTSGSWATELNKKGNNRALSHLTFFDTEGFTPDPPVGDPNGVPVPPAVWLFGGGLFGMLGFKRKKL